MGEAISSVGHFDNLVKSSKRLVILKTEVTCFKRWELSLSVGMCIRHNQTSRVKILQHHMIEWISSLLDDAARICTVLPSRQNPNTAIALQICMQYKCCILFAVASLVGKAPRVTRASATPAACTALASSPGSASATRTGVASTVT